MNITLDPTLEGRAICGQAVAVVMRVLSNRHACEVLARFQLMVQAARRIESLFINAPLAPCRTKDLEERYDTMVEVVDQIKIRLDFLESQPPVLLCPIDMVCLRKRYRYLDRKRLTFKKKLEKEKGDLKYFVEYFRHRRRIRRSVHSEVFLTPQSSFNA